MDLSPFRERIEEQIGPIGAIEPIEKGFSFEQKFKIQADSVDYLARLSPLTSYAEKANEFALMQQLYANGVQCNRPISLFTDEASGAVCAVYSYVPGVDAEEQIANLPELTQYQIGVDAGRDLKRINNLRGETNTWKARKWQKHKRYVERYFQQAYRFQHDEQVLRFIETHYDPTEADRDHLQHDDFHLGNIILHGESYGGVIDFNRYDWGDPLHEFVKLEWFTWPVSAAFARGQIEGYFDNRPLDDAICTQISVYIAMSIFSTIVWTLETHPHTWPEVEPLMQSILTRYDYFARVRPQWAG